MKDSTRQDATGIVADTDLMYDLELLQQFDKEILKIFNGNDIWSMRGFYRKLWDAMDKPAALKKVKAPKNGFMRIKDKRRNSRRLPTWIDWAMDKWKREDQSELEFIYAIQDAARLFIRHDIYDREEYVK